MIALFLMAAPARAADCPDNAYVVARETSGKDTRIRCACKPGFTPGASGCTQALSEGALAAATPFIAGSYGGTVKAWVNDEGKEVEAALKRGVLLSGIVTGARSFATLFTPEGERVSVGQDTRLELAPLVDGVSLSIKNLKGHLRIDNEFGRKMREDTALVSMYSRGWLKKAMNRRFSVRVVGANAAVRGTDFLLSGTGSGWTLAVISGEVEFTPEGGEMNILGKGDGVVFGKDAPEFFRAGSRRKLKKDWVKASGIKKLMGGVEK